jgi:excinuclease UvrABC ATPase subunit
VTEFIEIRGARENNLKDVSLRIPKRQITIFTGVSGSGKSSIVFDTIATEAQRQLYENFSLFVRNFLPKYPPPETGRADGRHGGGGVRQELARERGAPEEAPGGGGDRPVGRRRQHD